jgi:hypothetical protein
MTAERTSPARQAPDSGQYASEIDRACSMLTEVRRMVDSQGLRPGTVIRVRSWLKVAVELAECAAQEIRADHG